MLVSKHGLKTMRKHLNDSNIGDFQGRCSQCLFCHPAVYRERDSDGGSASFNLSPCKYTIVAFLSFAGNHRSHRFVHFLGPSSNKLFALPKRTATKGHLLMANMLAERQRQCMLCRITAVFLYLNNSISLHVVVPSTGGIHSLRLLQKTSN